MNSWRATGSKLGRAAALALLGATLPLHGADSGKVLRYAIEVAETSLDPQKISDLYSNILNAAMFDTPLKYDYLERPLKLKPNTLIAMPDISADGRTYTLRVKPGIYFADDAAFKGKKRELTAADYVYSWKRLLDPKIRATFLWYLENKLVGADTRTPWWPSSFSMASTWNGSRGQGRVAWKASISDRDDSARTGSLKY